MFLRSSLESTETGGVAVVLIKCREATLAPQDGVIIVTDLARLLPVTERDYFVRRKR